MKMPILSREERVFREPSIFAVDMKAVTLDNVVVNLHANAKQWCSNKTKTCKECYIP